MRSFTSLGNFSTFLGGLVLAQVVAEQKALERAAVLVERAALKKIGHYQVRAGPFQAWPQLAAETQADRVTQHYTANDPLLRSGALFASISHEVDGMTAVVGSDDPVALWQEVGTKTNIPERSFLGGAAEEHKEEILEIVGGGVVVTLVGGNVPVELLRD